MRIEWLLCPICKSKTRLQLREDTELLASGDNRHSGSGEKRQFWSTENSHLQFE